MQSLDTNIVLRLMLGDIKKQRDLALQLIESSTGQFQVADVVFVELEYALVKYYELSRQQVVSLLNAFASHPKINCNRVLLTAVFPVYAKHPALSFTDIALGTYAGLNQASPLWTFDKKLATQLPAAKLLI